MEQDDSWYSFLRSRDWEILIMEALLHAPANEEKQQTFRISLTDNLSAPDPNACVACQAQSSEATATEKK